MNALRLRLGGITRSQIIRLEESDHTFPRRYRVGGRICYLLSEVKAYVEVNSLWSRGSSE